MKVVVTGGRGFIGRAVCGLLAARGAAVVALDNGWRTSLPPPEGVHAVDVDIRDRSGVVDAIRGAEIVLHLAAIQGTKNFYAQPQLVLDVNVRGVLNTVDACAQAGVRRLLFASSSEVYGIPTTFPTPESAPLVVPDSLNPRWSYGASKIVGELAVVNGTRAADGEFTILRYHNVYGPAMGWDHVIPEFITRLEREEEFTVQGDGEQRRTFCFVDDAAEATVAAAFASSTVGEILNVGNPGQEASVNELIGLLARISGKHIVPRHVPFAGEGTRRRVPDIGRARALIAFEPRVSLHEGLRVTYDWYARELRSGAVPSAG